MSMVPFSSNVLSAFMMTIINKNEKQLLRQVPRFLVTSYGPVIILSKGNDCEGRHMAKTCFFFASGQASVDVLHIFRFVRRNEWYWEIIFVLGFLLLDKLKPLFRWCSYFERISTSERFWIVQFQFIQLRMLLKQAHLPPIWRVKPISLSIKLST